MRASPSSPLQETAPAVASHPGYVRLVLPASHAAARAACRRFAALCGAGSTPRGLIVARSSGADPAVLEDHIALAVRAMLPGFRLAVVARGSDAARVRRIAEATAARHRARARAFADEHRAAAWLLER